MINYACLLKALRTCALPPRLVLFLAIISLVVGCQSPSLRKAEQVTVPTSDASSSVFKLEKLQAMDRVINSAISSNQLPGGVLWLEHKGQVYVKAYGKRAVLPAEELMTTDTIFDAASLTKVTATTPAMMLLIERGKVKLETAVGEYIPEFKGEGREKITVRHLFTHTSGLPPGITSREKPTNYVSGIAKAVAEHPRTTPGTEIKYSDVNFILLGEIVRRVSGMPLNDFVDQEVYRPLKMTDTRYLPPVAWLARIAPTEKVEGMVLRGVVHDPTSRRMGGVAGHAGVFFSAADLARYARMLLHEGRLDKVRIFKPETVRMMTSVHTDTKVNGKRGLGWDIDTGYSGPRGSHFPVGSYGHTGFTGTSMWLDPASQTFVIFLCNRNHPDGKGDVLSLRRQLGTLAAEAIGLPVQVSSQP